MSILIPLLTLGLSVVTLSPALAVTVSLAVMGMSALLNKLVFRYGVVLVTPMLSEDAHRAYLGTLWTIEHPDSLSKPGLGLMFWHRAAAEEAFAMLKAWNYGKLDDRDGNISLWIIDEGAGKYSFLLQPGHRLPSQVLMEDVLRGHEGPKAVASHHVLQMYFYNGVDYSGSASQVRLMKQLELEQCIRLNTFYRTDSNMKAARKQPLRLFDFRVYTRETVPTDSLAARLAWKNGRTETSKEIVDELDRLRRNPLD